MRLINQLRKLLPGFDIKYQAKNNCYSGIGDVNKEPYRSAGRALVTPRMKFLWISDWNYKNDPSKRFRYLKLEVHGKARNWRSKYDRDIVLNHLFCSGRTEKELISQLRKSLQIIKKQSKEPMLPQDVKATLEDVKTSTKKIDARDIVEFQRRIGKEEVEQMRKLGLLLEQAVVSNDTAKCDRLTTTIAKIVRGK